jgi:hypothetical protein
MARLTSDQKAHRVLQFLLGLRLPAALKALQRHGFTAADLSDGWDRLRALSQVPTAPDTSDAHLPALEALYAFEATWVPIARISLRQHHPEVAQWIFAQLPASERGAVILRVRVFCDLVSTLQAGARGPAGTAAVQMLQRRGLTDERIAEARVLLDAAQGAAPSNVPDPAKQHALDAALWTWYVEWSGLARIAIKERRVLRALGFLQTQREASTEADPEDDPPRPALHART